MTSADARLEAGRDMTARDAAAAATLETFASSGGKFDVRPADFEQLPLPLTAEALQARHAALFPNGVKGWREDMPSTGPVVPPPPHKVEPEMTVFLTWFNGGSGKDDADPVIKAAIGHLWWMTIQPFSAGNTLMACLVTNTLLGRADSTAERFYSLSAQMLQEQAAYELGLERTRKSSTDITAWVLWFLGCFKRALHSAVPTLDKLLVAPAASPKVEVTGFNARQRTMIEKLREEGGSVTTTRWAQHVQCSQDSAYRDILDLITKKVLRKEARGGRSTRYSLV